MRRLMLCLSLVGLLAGCSLGGVGQALDNAVLNQPDVETARTALPAYLVMTDALIERSPDNEDMLRAGALLYAFYSANLVPQPERARLLAERARDYGERAMCSRDDDLCGLTHFPYEKLSSLLPRLDEDDFPALNAGVAGWLVYIQSHADDWASLADLPKVEALLTRLLEIAPADQCASMHGYLATLKTLRPAALGGDPEGGREHFEQAIALSGGRDLSYKVEYAARYARLIYDRELHDRLLQEVLQADPHEKGLALSNRLAQQRARELLATADEYF